MRLLNPSPGEILDRLSILELKITAAEKSSRDATHFLAEKMSLQDALRVWDQSLKEDYPTEAEMAMLAEKKNGLAAVNALLWEAEDLVRALPETEMSKLAQLAKRIGMLNDQRADLVRELAILYGSADAHEKIYGVSMERGKPFVVKR